MELTRESTYAALDKSGIPDYMHQSLVEYIHAGRPVGNFLTAVITNDLREACDRADDKNKHKLFEYVFFLYNHAPRNCWGSEQNMLTWISHRGMEWNTEGSDGPQR